MDVANSQWTKESNCVTDETTRSQQGTVLQFSLLQFRMKRHPDNESTRSSVGGDSEQPDHWPVETTFLKTCPVCPPERGSRTESCIAVPYLSASLDRNIQRLLPSLLWIYKLCWRDWKVLSGEKIGKKSHRQPKSNSFLCLMELACCCCCCCCCFCCCGRAAVLRRLYLAHLSRLLEEYRCLKYF